VLTTAKITKKGQVTIPKQIRERLKSDIIEFDIVDDTIIIKPVKSVAGSLKKYAKTVIPFKEAREKAWDEVTDERYGKKAVRR
jgi:AbrB family looped-hinge helix DNA binding protein